MIAENLGRAPRCPDDYWKSQVGLGESRNLNRPMTTRELVKFRNEYNREIKRLEAKYHDYFE